MSQTAFESALQNIVSHADAETVWLNLLSQLEYVGCRKIVRSVSYDRIDVDLLQHISEEALHAYLLKRLVSTRGGESKWEKSPLTEIGWEYIQGLDQAVSALVADSELCYPLVSWTIEQRVLWLYPEYLKATKDDAVRRTIRQILAQEERHASQFEVAEQFKGAQAALAIEKELWAKFVDGVNAYFKQSELGLEDGRDTHSASSTSRQESSASRLGA